jgi:hypothetical protein
VALCMSAWQVCTRSRRGCALICRLRTKSRVFRGDKELLLTQLRDGREIDCRVHFTKRLFALCRRTCIERAIGCCISVVPHSSQVGLVDTHRPSCKLLTLDMLHPTGAVPNVQWRRVAGEHLQQHPEFVPLPAASSFAVSDAAHLRLFPQHGLQWEALHARRLTTSTVAAFIGFFEAEHASLLHVPRSMVGHDRSVEAWRLLTDADGPAGDLPGLQLLAASAARSDEMCAAPTSEHSSDHRTSLQLSGPHSLLLTAGLAPISSDDVCRAQSADSRAGAGSGVGSDDAVDGRSVWERVLPESVQAGKRSSSNLLSSPTESVAALVDSLEAATVGTGLSGETAASTVATAPPFRFRYTPPIPAASAAGAGQPLRAPQSAFASAHEARLAWGSSQEAVGVLALVNALLLPQGGEAGAATCRTGAATERVSACAASEFGSASAASDSVGVCAVCAAAAVVGITHPASAPEATLCSGSGPREGGASRMYEVGLLPLEAVPSEHLKTAYGCTHPQLPLIGASPDGLIIYGDGAVEVCEVKCRSPFAQLTSAPLQPQGAACAGRGQRHRRPRPQLASPHFCIRDDGPMEGGVTPWHVPQLQLEVLCAGPHCRGVNLVSVSATKGATVYYMPRSDEYIRALLRIISLLHTTFVNPAWAQAAPTTAGVTGDSVAAAGNSSTAAADGVVGTTPSPDHDAGEPSEGGRVTGDDVEESKGEDDESGVFPSAVVQPPSWQAVHARRRSRRKGRGGKSTSGTGPGRAVSKPTAAAAPPKPRCFPAGYTAAIPGYRAFLELTLSLARRAQLRCRLSHDQVQRSPHDGGFFLDHAHSSR